MTIELLYTSAAQGLKQGSRGFCTVVSTAGLPINLAQRLEALSGYRHLYQPGDPRADDNPICHSHIRLAVGGKMLSILSRVSAYGVDYSQRTNKIAHHVVFDGPVPPCGPASVLLEPGIMRTSWDGECKTLQSGPSVPSLSLKPSPCNDWQQITGDAGWAGVVANAWLQPTGKPVWIIFSESQSGSLLALMQEAIAILPETKRWQATFSTYCTNLPPDVECRVRCVIAGSDEARMSIARGLVVDLTKPMPKVVDSPASQAARVGHLIGGETAKHAMPKAMAEVGTLENNSELNELSERLSTLTEREYHVESSSSVPPSFSPPQPYLKKNLSIGRAETLNGRRNWTRIAMTATAAAALLIGGTFTVLYLNSQMHLSSEHETTSKTEPSTQQEENQNIISNAAQPDSSISNETPKSNATPSRMDVSKHQKTELHLEQQEIKSWAENKPIFEETKIAVIAVKGSDGDNVKMVDGHEWFAFKSDTKEIYLKTTDGFDYEKTTILQAKFECNGENTTIKVAVTNVNEPTLKLNILADDGMPSKFAFLGQTVRVRTSGYLNEASQNATPSFQWKGKTNGVWADLADEKSESYRITDDCKFSNLKCNATDNAGTETVESNEIAICPLGEVTIEIDELLQFSDSSSSSLEKPGFFPIKVRLAFPEFAVNKKMVRRFEFAGNVKSVSDAKNLEFSFDSTGDQYRFPKKLFNRSIGDTGKPKLEQIEESISKLIAASKACSTAKDQFKGSIKHINSEGEVIKPLKEFFGGMDFPQNLGDLEDVDSFLRQIEKAMRINTHFTINFSDIESEIDELKRTFEKSKDETTENKLRKLTESLDAFERFRSFEKAIPNVIKAKLKNNARLNDNLLGEIRLLGEGLQKSQDKNQSLGTNWRALVKSASELKAAIDSLSELELILFSEHDVVVWLTEGSQDPIKIKKENPRIDPISLPQIFKIRFIPSRVMSTTKSQPRKADSSGRVSRTNDKRPLPRPMSVTPSETP